MGFEWLTPALTVLGSVIVAIIGASAIVWRRRQDRRDAIQAAQVAHEPHKTDEWEEVRLARAEATKYYNWYRTFENLYYTVLAALRHLARKVHEAHPDEVLDKDVTDALALKPPETDDTK